MRKQAAHTSALSVALVFIGTVIGAGFATGAEIMTYFTRFGEAGFWGMLAAAALLWIGAGCTLHIAYEYKSTDCGSFTQILAGKWAGAVLDACITLSMLLGYGAMLAGSGAVFAQQWGMPESAGIILMTAAVLLALHRGEQGILWVNRLLTPLLILGILLLGIYSVYTAGTQQETAGLLLQPISAVSAQPVKELPQALHSAVLYASYNMLGASAVLIGVSSGLKSLRQAHRAALTGAAILLVLTFAIGVATFLNYDTIKGASIPVLALLEKRSLWQKMYVWVLLGAMYTTAVADGFGAAARIQTMVRFSRGTVCVLTTLAALGLAHLGFGRLVAGGYRLMGYLGIVQLVLTIIRCIPKKRGEHT